jgi:type IV secretory pathway VirB3-like protein
MPMTIFFIVLYINFRKASIFGITMEYLGIITYYQIIQFFQNFKCIYNFYLALLMASKLEYQAHNSSFSEVIECCHFFGKFSNGITLFIMKILCFVILVDSFNINIVSSIIVIDPYYILGIVTGCLGIYCLTSLDIRSGEIFSKFLLQRIKRQVLRNINSDEYEPPYAEIANDMTHIAIVN